MAVWHQVVEQEVNQQFEYFDKDLPDGSTLQQFNTSEQSTPTIYSDKSQAARNCTLNYHAPDFLD